MVKASGRINISDFIFSWPREQVVIVSGTSDGSISRYMVAGVDADEVFRP
jgi:hypothetical protein